MSLRAQTFTATYSGQTGTITLTWGAVSGGSQTCNWSATSSGPQAASNFEIRNGTMGSIAVELGTVYNGNPRSGTFSLAVGFTGTMGIQPYGDSGWINAGVVQTGGSSGPASAPPAASKVSPTVKLSNPYGVPETFSFVDSATGQPLLDGNGNPIVYTVQPGQTSLVQVEKTNSDPVAVFAHLNGYQSVTDSNGQVAFQYTGSDSNSVSWGYASIPDASFTSGSTSSGSVTTDTPVTGTNTNVVPPASGVTVPGSGGVAPVTQVTPTAIWSSSGSSSTGLDQATYQQGAQGISTAVQTAGAQAHADAQNASSQAHSDALSLATSIGQVDGDLKNFASANHTDLGAIKSDLDTQATNATAAQTADASYYGSVSYSPSNSPNVTALEGVSSSSVSVGVAPVPSAPSNTTATFNLPGADPITADWNIFDLALPGSSTTIASLCAYIRTAIVWLATVAWVYWAFDYFLVLFADLGKTPQVKAQTDGASAVPGVGTVRAFSMAVIIVAALATLPVVLAAVWSTNLSGSPGGTIIGIVSSGAFSGSWPSELLSGLWWVDHVIPVIFLFYLYGYRWFVRAGAASAYGAAVAVIKFAVG